MDKGRRETTEETKLTFRGSRVLSSPINQKLSDSADIPNQPWAIRHLEQCSHPENQVGYTIAGEVGVPKVL